MAKKNSKSKAQAAAEPTVQQPPDLYELLTTSFEIIGEQVVLERVSQRRQANQQMAAAPPAEPPDSVVDLPEPQDSPPAAEG